MRKITKQPQPQKFIEATKGKYATSDYEELPSDVKDALRESLCKEQGFLCCYCMQRIEPNSSSMHVEHWQCQDNHPERQLDYRNMLGACQNSRGLREKNQYCAVKKDNDDLKFNPADDNVENFIQYTHTGKIKSQDSEFDEQLNTVLNLNCDKLKNDRKSCWQSFAALMNKRWASKQQTWKLEKLVPAIEECQTPDANGKLREYSNIILFMLKKKQKQLQK